MKESTSVMKCSLFCLEKRLNNPNGIDNIVGVSATGELISLTFDSKVANQLDRTVISDVNTSIVLDEREK